MKNKHLPFFRLGVVRYAGGFYTGICVGVFTYEGYDFWVVLAFLLWMILAFLDILGELLDFIDRSKNHKRNDKLVEMTKIYEEKKEQMKREAKYE